MEEERELDDEDSCERVVMWLADLGRACGVPSGESFAGRLLW